MHTFLPITPELRSAYDALVNHPLQSYSWGEFREKTGVKVIRRGLFDGKKLIAGFSLTIHKVPHTPYTIGYLPKGILPTSELLSELKKIGSEEHCLFIQLEPNIIKSINGVSQNVPFAYKKLGLTPASHPLFTQFTFILDLTKSEDELLAGMHPKARYNIKVAQKHHVLVEEMNTQKGFESYWKLTEETTTRQKFYAHSKSYHQKQWSTFSHDTNKNELTSHLFVGSYDHQILTTLLMFIFHDTLYYPYGASSNIHRNVMHSNLTMWEAILFGKKMGLKKFDMWGALGTKPDTSDPWYGFHNFKEKFGPDHVEFLGSYDLVINPLLYRAYIVADKLRWLYLKMKK